MKKIIMLGCILACMLCVNVVRAEFIILDFKLNSSDYNLNLKMNGVSISPTLEIKNPSYEGNTSSLKARVEYNIQGFSFIPKSIEFISGAFYADALEFGLLEPGLFGTVHKGTYKFEPRGVINSEEDGTYLNLYFSDDIGMTGSVAFNNLGEFSADDLTQLDLTDEEAHHKLSLGWISGTNLSADLSIPVRFVHAANPLLTLTGTVGFSAIGEVKIIPEPSSVVIMLLGLVGIAVVGRRRFLVREA